MTGRISHGGGVRDESAAIRLLAEQGLSARAWGNGPGDGYARHRHAFHKVLYCVTGGITFHTADGELVLRAGDRLDLEPGTEHAATVGPDGVRCVEGGG